jgi:hypothetical protein
MALLLTRVSGQFPGLGTRTLLGILFGLSLISFVFAGPGLFLLSPGTLLWRPWTLVTGPLTEPNILVGLPHVIQLSRKSLK